MFMISFFKIYNIVEHLSSYANNESKYNTKNADLYTEHWARNDNKIWNNIIEKTIQIP